MIKYILKSFLEARQTRQMRRIFNKLPKFKTFEDMISYIDNEENKSKFSMIQNKMNRVIEPTLEENAFYMHYRGALDERNKRKIIK